MQKRTYSSENDLIENIRIEHGKDLEKTLVSKMFNPKNKPYYMNCKNKNMNLMPLKPI